MIEQLISNIDGKPYIFCQCETVEEQKKYKLPPNMFSFWKHGEEIILTPGQVLDKIQNAIANNNYVPEAITRRGAVESYYKKLLVHQNNSVIEYAQAQIDSLKDAPNKEQYSHYIKEMEQVIKEHKNHLHDFDMDGVVRADTKRAKEMLGETMYNQVFPEGSAFLDRQSL